MDWFKLYQEEKSRRLSAEIDLKKAHADADRAWRLYKNERTENRRLRAEKMGLLDEAFT